LYVFRNNMLHHAYFSGVVARERRCFNFVSEWMAIPRVGPIYWRLCRFSVQFFPILRNISTAANHVFHDTQLCPQLIFGTTPVCMWPFKVWLIPRWDTTYRQFMFQGIQLCSGARVGLVLSILIRWDRFTESARRLCHESKQTSFSHASFALLAAIVKPRLPWLNPAIEVGRQTSVNDRNLSLLLGAVLNAACSLQ